MRKKHFKPEQIVITLAGVEGYCMGVDKMKYRYLDKRIIDRDVLIIPEVLIETFADDYSKVMKVAFDTIWNAAGWPRSMNYNETGDWTGQR